VVALPTVACAAEAIVAAVGIRASDIDSPLPADPPVGVATCEASVAEAALVGEGVLPAAAAASVARRSVCADVEDCFDRPARRRVCRKGCAPGGGADGVARGCCNSLVLLGAVESVVLDASTVGASAAVSSVVEAPPAAAAVEALETATALGVEGVEGRTAAAGACGVLAVVGLEAATVDSDAAVD
jgi:hypothetical protein